MEVRPLFRQSKTIDKVKTDLLVDLAIFVAFLITMDPRSSGVAVHEWLSLALTVAVLVHLLLHWNWIVFVTRRFLSKAPRRSRINYILNTLLFIDSTVIVFTGLMISEAVLPSFGIRLESSFLWGRLHDLSANLALFLIGLHLAFHWRWIVSTSKRYVTRFFAPARSTPVAVKEQTQL